MRYQILGLFTILGTFFIDLFIVAYFAERYWPLTSAVVITFFVTAAGIALILWFDNLDDKFDD